MKALVDTNIIIDAVTGREPWKEAAEQIFLLAANRMVEMYITSSMATDIYYIVKKHLHNSTEAKSVMKKLYILFRILEVTSTDCIDALQSSITDYEDAVVEQTARRYGMDYIITRNIKDYELGSVRGIIPDVFLKIVNDEII